MSQWKIAHIREQGVDLIIVPLEPSFGRKSSADQHGIIDGLQQCSISAGLAGTVVPVWREGSGHRFVAQPNWHPFFKSLSWNAILGNLNKTLTCQ